MKTEIIHDKTFRTATHVCVGGTVQDVRMYAAHQLKISPEQVRGVDTDASISASTFIIPHEDHPTAMVIAWFPETEISTELLLTIVHEATHVAIISLFDKVGHPSDRAHYFQEVLAYTVERYFGEFMRIIQEHGKENMRVRKGVGSHGKARSQQKRGTSARRSVA